MIIGERRGDGDSLVDILANAFPEVQTVTIGDTPGDAHALIHSG